MRENRIKSGLTQRDLALKLNFTSGQFVSNYERGLCPIPIDKIRALINILHLDKNEVIELMQSDSREQLTKDLSADPRRRRASNRK